MSRARWIVLVPVLALLAALAWRFWPRVTPMPYEGVNDPPAARDAAPRDAGAPH